MRWSGSRRSGNIEDRRGMGPGMLAGGGIGTVVIALIAMFLGVDPGVVLQGGGPQGAAPGPQGGAPPPDDARAEFVSRVLADTEDAWSQLFREKGQSYEFPKLVLFEQAVQSACGTAQSAVGPFYCPLDHKVYIDLGFFDELQRRFRVPGDGDFAQAYVISHEVGHHVQTLLGISERVHAMSQRAGREQANELSVRQELQADCFAGVSSYHAQRLRLRLEPGDVEEALSAASAIGDDRLQMESQGYVVPESFTHGTSEQRVRWFQRGLQSGSMEQCDTFGAAAL